jgi:hypothetical protein
MPQKSVMPAKTSPAPTKTANPKKPGFTAKPNPRPINTSDPAEIRTCRSIEIVPRPRFTRQPLGFPGIHTAFEHQWRKAPVRHFLRRRPRPPPGLADNHAILPLTEKIAHPASLQLIQGQQNCAVDILCAIFARRPHVEEQSVGRQVYFASIDRFHRTNLTFRHHPRQTGNGNRCAARGILVPCPDATAARIP